MFNRKSQKTKTTIFSTQKSKLDSHQPTLTFTLTLTGGDPSQPIDPLDPSNIFSRPENFENPVLKNISNQYLIIIVQIVQNRGFEGVWAPPWGGFGKFLLALGQFLGGCWSRSSALLRVKNQA